MQERSVAQVEPIHIEGTTLEGGGQLVRISLCLSALTGRAIRITSIRGNRSRGGGLKGQHLIAAQWLAKACTGGAYVAGLSLGSQTLVFAPEASGSPSTAVEEDPWRHHKVVNKPNGEQIAARATVLDLKTPGAVTLVLQALLPYMLFSPPRNSSSAEPILLTIRGGTNVSMAPSIDYIHHVLFPNLRLLFSNIPGIEVLMGAKRLRRGWSTGKTVLGEVDVLITPLARGTRLHFNRDRVRTPLHETRVTSLKAIVLAPSNTPLPSLVQRELYSATRQSFRLFDKSNIEMEIEDSRDPKRLYLLLVAETSSGIRVGRDWLFDRGLKIERDSLEKTAKSLVERVVDDLLMELSSKVHPLDSHMMDQIVVFQALAETDHVSTELPVQGDENKDYKPKEDASLHTLTAHWISSLILGKGSSSESHSISTNRGVGFTSGVVGGGLWS